MNAPCPGNTTIRAMRLGRKSLIDILSPAPVRLAAIQKEVRTEGFYDRDRSLSFPQK